MKIDINKKYRTRDRREVTHLYRVPDGYPTPYPWRGLAGDIEESWTEEGVYDIAPDRINSYMDLIEVREPREWVLIVAKKTGDVDWDATTSANFFPNKHFITTDPYEAIRVREIID